VLRTPCALVTGVTIDCVPGGGSTDKSRFLETLTQDAEDKVLKQSEDGRQFRLVAQQSALAAANPRRWCFCPSIVSRKDAKARRRQPAIRRPNSLKAPSTASLRPNPFMASGRSGHDFPRSKGAPGAATRFSCSRRTVRRAMAG